jgi:hypothetical protein
MLKINTNRQDVLPMALDSQEEIEVGNTSTVIDVPEGQLRVDPEDRGPLTIAYHPADNVDVAQFEEFLSIEE